MLITYNFYNSLLLQRMVQQFVRRGNKEKIEKIVYATVVQFSRVHNFSYLWIFLAVIELHKPVLALQNFKSKNRIVQKPRVRAAQKSLVGIGLRWLKEGVLGNVPKIKQKRQLKIMRKQVKSLQKKVKVRGFILTASEQTLIEKLRVLQLQKRVTRPFIPAFRAYINDSGQNFKSSLGYKHQQVHNSIIVENFRYRSYQW